MSANIKKVYVATRDGRLYVIEPSPHRKSTFEFERDISELGLWQAQPDENEIPFHLNPNELPMTFNLRGFTEEVKSFEGASEDFEKGLKRYIDDEIKRLETLKKDI